MVHADAPLAGFVRAREGDELFAFACEAIVRDRLWHWTLLPADQAHGEAEALFARASHEPPTEWLSVVEDRRTDEPTLAGVWLGSKDWTTRRAT